MSNHVEDFISAYVDQELSEIERGQVERHLQSCLHCRSILHDVIDIQNQVRAAFLTIEAPQTVEDTAVRAIKAGVPKASARRYWLFMPLLSAMVLFSVVFAFMGTYVFKLAPVSFKVIVNLIYAAGSLLGSEVYIIAGFISFSLLVMIASSLSLKRLLRTKAL